MGIAAGGGFYVVGDFSYAGDVPADRVGGWVEYGYCHNVAAWWPFVGGNAAEVVGGLNGTLVGNYSFISRPGYGSGQPGGLALSLSGTGGVYVADNPALNFGWGNFGIDLYVQATSADTGARELVSKQGPNDLQDIGYSLYLTNGVLAFHMQDQIGRSLTASGGGDLRDGGWHHVGVSVERACNGRLFVDGGLVATFDPTSVSNALSGPSAPLLIGLRQPYPADVSVPVNFVGAIHDVAIFRTAFDAPDVGVGILSPGDSRHLCSARCPSALSAWWPLEGNAMDIIGGETDTMLPGNYGFVAGEVGLGVGLNGPGEGISATNRPALNFGPGNDFSIDAWIQPVSANTSYGVMDIVDKRITPNDQSAQGYELCLVNGELVFQMSDSTNTSPLSFVSSEPDLRDGWFHHVAVTVHRSSSTGGTLYVDGLPVLAFDPTPRQGDLGTTAPLFIGHHPSPWLDGGFRGTIDEPSLYARALADWEIMAIFTADSLGKCGSP